MIIGRTAWFILVNFHTRIERPYDIGIGCRKVAEIEPRTISTSNLSFLRGSTFSKNFEFAHHDESAGPRLRRS